MPSSLIFVGLVVLWLLILVPTVARRQQEVARLSPALLSGRVLERPMRHRYPEVGQMERSAPSTVGELVEARGDVPGPRGRGDDRYDETDTESDTEFDAEIDDDGRVYGLDDDLDEGWDDRWDDDGRERDPRPVAPPGADLDGDDADPADPADEPDLESDLEDSRHDVDRPDGSYDEIDEIDEIEDDGDGFDDDGEVDDDWEDPPPRYRPGRGGFDPEAAAAAAHAKYAFRQRVVLALLVLVVAAGATALLVSTVFWWVAGGLGLGLVGYLTYLRRQVRIEESIRARRAARLSRRPRPAEAEPEECPAPEPEGSSDEEPGTPEQGEEDLDWTDDDDWTADDGESSRIRGTGEPLGVLPARRRTVDGPSSDEHESSLPRLAAAPPPPVPAGTSLVDVDAEEEPEDLDDLTPHRRAVGE